MSGRIKEIAKQTIVLQAKSISGLIAFIDDDFEKAVQQVLACKGRLVITGIGKSAIVGQKIVATLNSTGTPALFMHAGDAIHGDLGMIQMDDIVMVISKSGESPEIKALLPLIKTRDNTVIGMVGNTQSFLARQSNIILNTTVEREACPNNLAPTTSTTAQMVMGDALAVTLMELKGFTGGDFARLHPGGNLGKKLYLRVDDIYVHNQKPTVIKEASLKNVILEITKGRLGATAVVDDNNKVIGIITDGDIRRLLERTNDLSNITAADIVVVNAKATRPGTLAITAFEIIKEHDISQLLITDENDNYIGMLHLHDLIREGIME
ncbi:MAG TPA: KpsF/GutQ family sugar-phosphate isomerase [Chitinophagaceae bacterium]|nr:KpsF/GutQ family sugar-phosphate isomerase [Chitinophagaceae bacterium]